MSNDIPKMVPSAEERVAAATTHYLGTLNPLESVPVVEKAFRDGYEAAIAHAKARGLFKPLPFAEDEIRGKKRVAGKIVP